MGVPGPRPLPGVGMPAEKFRSGKPRSHHFPMPHGSGLGVAVTRGTSKHSTVHAYCLPRGSLTNHNITVSLHLGYPRQIVGKFVIRFHFRLLKVGEIVILNHFLCWW